MFLTRMFLNQQPAYYSRYQLGGRRTHGGRLAAMGNGLVAELVVTQSDSSAVASVLWDSDTARLRHWSVRHVTVHLVKPEVPLPT